MRYADLVIDNRSDQTDRFYTYACERDDIRVGQKVSVHFARSKAPRDAYVFAVRDKLEEEIPNLRFIEAIDPEISLTPEMIRVCEWMKQRYLVRYIDAVRLFLPAGTPSKRGKKRRPFADAEGEAQDIRELTEEQSRALGAITGRKPGEDLFLLRGVTGSGKTEIYMRAIADTLAREKTAIMLVPEISLTKQIIDRFIGRFGERDIAVLHSRLTRGERYDEWQRIRRGEARIVIGARSAVFAPLSDIGLIVLDEEHESTYKSDMTPRYDTVEVAIKRARAHGGAVVMGSATPSVVSYSRAREGTYRLLELHHRYNRTPLPRVRVVDMRKELREGNRSVFSRELYSAMEQTLADGRQVILFLNRRGYSTFVSCRACGHVLQCPSCGVSMTYHKGDRVLECHYCGRREPVPAACPSCGSRMIRYFGTGTEKIQEAAAELFERYPGARLDLDVMKKKGALEKILEDFGEGRTKILTGTQVVAKGLDFRNVGLVGVVSADVTLNLSDYRAAERAFQLITQAAGRAGRGERAGSVIIQTYSPDHYAVRAAAAQDYLRFYEEEIRIRKLMDYPPYSDLIQVIFSEKGEDAVMRSAEDWKEGLCRQLPECAGRIFPPRAIPAQPGKDEQRAALLIRCPRGRRAAYMRAIGSFDREWTARHKAKTTVDVNPYHL